MAKLEAAVSSVTIQLGKTITCVARRPVTGSSQALHVIRKSFIVNQITGETERKGPTCHKLPLITVMQII